VSSSRPVDRAAILSLVVATLVLSAKIGAAWRSGSVALLADAMESVVNVVAAIALLVVVRWSRRPADSGHPWGHGKIEYFAAAFEGSLVVGAGLVAAWEAVRRLWHPSTPELDALALVLSVGAMAANLALGLHLRRVGRTHRSPALIADGTHVLADVFTTVGALVGLLIATATGWGLADPVAALLVVAVILKEGAEVVRHSVAGLLDEALQDEDLAAVQEAIEANLGVASDAHDLRTRRAADQAFVEFHLVVPGQITVAASHDRCDALEEAIGAVLPGARVTIHVEPEDFVHEGDDALPAVGS
jgi:cation diffusion facilitator family transporter